MAGGNASRTRGTAIAVVAAALTLLVAADAGASQCRQEKRVDHSDAECLSATWKKPGAIQEEHVPGPEHVSALWPGGRQGRPRRGEGPDGEPRQRTIKTRLGLAPHQVDLLLFRHGHLQPVGRGHRRSMPGAVQAREHGASELQGHIRFRQPFRREAQLQRLRLLPFLTSTFDPLPIVHDYRSVHRSGQRAQLPRQAEARALRRRSPRYGQSVGVRRGCPRGRAPDPGIQGVLEPDIAGDGEDRLRHLRRHGDSRVGLQGDLGHADLQAGRDGKDRLRAGVRRWPRRGRREADADAVQPAPGVAGPTG